MKRFTYDTHCALEVKNRRLHFLLPKEATDGIMPLNAYHFRGELPQGVEASWRTYIDDQLKDEGTRLAGDFFIPAPRFALMPQSRFTLEIDTTEDIKAPSLLCTVQSQPFFYEPSLLEIPIPPEFAGNPEAARAFRQQMAMMMRPSTMDDVDPSRVDLLNDGLTRGEERKLTAKCGPPMQGMLEILLNPEATTKSSIFLVQ